MMNVTVEEKKRLEDHEIHNSKYKDKRYSQKRFCPLKHELARIYSRLYIKGSLRLIPHHFYCDICKKIYQEQLTEVSF